MKRDRLEFLEAMRLLGDAAGVERPNTSPQARQQAGQRQQLLDACSTAAGVFQKYLAGPAGEAGRAYLAERGFNDAVVQQFQIGLAADGWDGLLRADAMRPFGPAVLAMAGLVKPRENGGGYYDTFRNRLMFPIRDETGRIDRLRRAGHAGVDRQGQVSEQPRDAAVQQEPDACSGWTWPGRRIVETPHGGRRRGVRRRGHGPPVRGQQRRLAAGHGPDRART